MSRRKPEHLRKLKRRTWEERYDALLSCDELIRLRRLVGLPDTGPDRATHRRWSAEEATNP